MIQNGRINSFTVEFRKRLIMSLPLTLNTVLIFRNMKMANAGVITREELQKQAEIMTEMVSYVDIFDKYQDFYILPL